MIVLKEGEQYFDCDGGELVVPEDEIALVDDNRVLLVSGDRREVVTELAALLVAADLQSMTVTWAKRRYVDVSGTTVYL